MKRIRFVASLVFFVPLSLWGDPRGEEIMQRVLDQPVPRTTIVKLKMVLESAKGNYRQERVVKIWGVAEKGKARTLLKFVSPPEVAGIALLVRENPDGTRDQWLYLPALKQEPRRVASSQKNQSFLGTEFTYADLEGTTYEAWDHDFQKEVTEGGVKYYLVRSTPKPEAHSPYAYVIQWIHGELYFPQKVEFYDTKGKLKELRVEKYEKVGKYLLAQRTVMENLRTGKRTVLEVLERELDVKIPSRIFTKRYMKRPF